ncbi:MAG TPA: ribonuclease D [Nocardioidaceae bacterium]|nr:ribonuclease D [Nocardioidaceae bacterium]
MSEPQEASTPEETAPDETPEPAPLLELRDGLTGVVDDDERLAESVAAFAAASGPVAIDAERASGYRYTARAYLVQLRREGAGTALIDPVPFENLDSLQAALDGTEWILHAASQDLPCLTELGLRPAALFDTELAGRLLGYPRVGLATLVETILGRSMRKEHSAVDWSTRPLPQPWLEYAALDVEVLIELREALGAELESSGKAEWAKQEFEHLINAAPGGPKPDPWRRTSGLHRVRGRRSLAAVRALWEARDTIAQQRDVTPGRIIPDSAIVEAANALPKDKPSLLGLQGFHGRGAERYANSWVGALRDARALPDEELPQLAARYDGPPPPRTWADKDPVAAARLSHARAAMATLSEELQVPTENILSPDLVRRVTWEPPEGEESLADRLAERLTSMGARQWQVELTSELLVAAIEAAPEAVADTAAEADPEAT